MDEFVPESSSSENSSEEFVPNTQSDEEVVPDSQPKSSPLSRQTLLELQDSLSRQAQADDRLALFKDRMAVLQKNATELEERLGRMKDALVANMQEQVALIKNQQAILLGNSPVVLETQQPQPQPQPSLPVKQQVDLLDEQKPGPVGDVGVDEIRIEFYKNCGFLPEDYLRVLCKNPLFTSHLGKCGLTEAQQIVFKNQILRLKRIEFSKIRDTVIERLESRLESEQVSREELPAMIKDELERETGGRVHFKSEKGAPLCLLS